MAKESERDVIEECEPPPLKIDGLWILRLFDKIDIDDYWALRMMEVDDDS